MMLVLEWMGTGLSVPLEVFRTGCRRIWPPQGVMCGVRGHDRVCHLHCWDLSAHVQSLTYTTWG